MNPSARKKLVTQLITSGEIASQQGLVKALESNGVVVTQTTASRDLVELGAVRGKDALGRSKYFLSAESTSASSRTRMNRQLILSVESSGNIVVLKTLPGGAQLIAGQLDRMITAGQLRAALGTIAGDDTLIVISRGTNGATGLAREIANIADGDPVKSTPEVTARKNLAQSVVQPVKTKRRK